MEEDMEKQDKNQEYREFLTDVENEESAFILNFGRAGMGGE